MSIPDPKAVADFARSQWSWAPIVLVPLVLGQIAGCTTETAIVGGTAGIVTTVGGAAPAQDIEQVYYLGVIDPQEQLPPTINRVTVRGQASAISGMKFGSGWVPASLIDSLGTRLSFDDNGDITNTGPSGDLASGAIQTGRRLVLFGPEGFREAPRDHRLVIVMGSSPEDFFNAIDTALGDISQMKAKLADGASSADVLQKLLDIRREQDSLSDVGESLRSQVELTGGAQ